PAVLQASPNTKLKASSTMKYPIGNVTNAIRTSLLNVDRKISSHLPFEVYDSLACCRNTSAIARVIKSDGVRIVRCASAKNPVTVEETKILTSKKTGAWLESFPRRFARSDSLGKSMYRLARAFSCS